MIHAAEQQRPDVQAQRQAWRQRTQAIDPARFVFLDETGIHTSMTRPRGWSLRSERVIGQVPHGHWKMTTLIAAVRNEGVVAPLVFEGATDAVAFETYVTQVLVPVLHPGDIVVWDNRSAHKGAAVHTAVTAAGAEVWPLPPYSPDLNPIEPLWSKVKSRLKAVGARTRQALWGAIGPALDAVLPHECRNYFAHCGYPATNDCNLL